MTKIIKSITTLAACVASLASCASLFVWLVAASVILRGNSSGRLVAKYGFESTSTMNTALDFRDYFFVAGGALGWVALLALWIAHRKPLSRIPKWVFLGLFLGCGSALSMLIPSASYNYVYIFPPIATALLLLLRSSVNERHV